jgi:hypothetical protein
MKYRILIWAALGFLVAAGWAIYAYPTISSADRLLPLIEWTCPITLFRSHPINLVGVLVSNSLVYALIGFAVEVLRGQVKHAH